MFGKKRISELDALFESLAMNKSNNYKDAVAVVRTREA